MPPSTYQEAAEVGDTLGVLRQAALFASLWAIGSSWSTAIREMVVALLPERDEQEVVVAELTAATITTLFALGLTFLVSRCCQPACCGLQKITFSSASSSVEVGVERIRPSRRRPLPPPRR